MSNIYPRETPFTKHEIQLFAGDCIYTEILS